MLGNISYFNLISFVFIIFFTTSINYASTLNLENIIGGWYANQYNFKFQVAILSRTNYSRDYNSNCGGGLIADNFVLSVAHCFADSRLRLRNLSFTVSAGHVDLLSTRCIKIDVDTIYIHHYNKSNALNDIAVLKLQRNIDISPYLGKLQLPAPDQSFARSLGRVAGYGWTSIDVVYNPLTQKSKRIRGNVDFRLKYGMVRIISGTECDNKFSHFNVSRQMCAVTIPYFQQVQAGICSGDSGGPLVVANTIVGIASRSPVNCDDTVDSTIYTKITGFLDFIEAALAGTPTIDTTTYYNHPYQFIG